MKLRSTVLFIIFVIICSVLVVSVPLTTPAPVLTSPSNYYLTTENISVQYIQNTGVKYVNDWHINDGGFNSIALLNSPFEFGSTASTTPDYSTWNNPGTVNGLTWADSSGVDGHGAYVFDGITSHIDYDVNMQYVNNMTVGCWIKPAQIPIPTFSKQTIASHVNAPGGPPDQLLFNIIRASDDTELSFTSNVSEGTSATYNISGWTQDQWHYVVGRFSIDEGKVRLSVDGTTVANAGGAITIGMQTANFTIGAIDETDAVFNGTIDECMVWNRSLSDNQIYSNFINFTNVTVSDETNQGEEWEACVRASNTTAIGNEVCAISKTVVVDTFSPSVLELTPSTGTYVGVNQPLELSTKVTDETQVQTVTLSLFMPNGSTFDIALAKYMDSNKWNKSYIMPDLLGDYTLTIEATDTLSNYNNTQSATFTALNTFIQKNGDQVQFNDGDNSASVNFTVSNGSQTISNYNFELTNNGDDTYKFGFTTDNITLGSEASQSTDQGMPGFENIILSYSSNKDLVWLGDESFGYIKSTENVVFDDQTYVKTNYKKFNFRDMFLNNPAKWNMSVATVSLNKTGAKTFTVTLVNASNFDPVIEDTFLYTPIQGTFINTTFLNNFSGIGLEPYATHRLKFGSYNADDLSYYNNDAESKGYHSLVYEDGNNMWTTEGVVGSALRFFGGPPGDDCMQHGPDNGDPIIPEGDNYTYMFWLNKTSQTNAHEGLYGYTVSNGAQFWPYDSYTWNGVLISVIGNSTEIQYANSGQTPNLNRWEHWAINFNQTNVNTFRNGSLVNTLVVTLGGTVPKKGAAINGRELLMASYGCYVYNTNATVDELKVFNRSLSTQEIETIYGNESLGFNDPLLDEKNWLADIKFNQTEGLTATDQTAEDNKFVSIYGFNRPYLNTTDGFNGTGAYVFNGQSSYLNFGDINDVGNNNFSISLFLKTNHTGTASTSYNQPINKRWAGLANAGGYQISVPDGRVIVTIANGTTFQNIIAGTVGDYNNGQMYHVAATVEVGGNVTIYIDSAKKESTALTVTGSLNNSRFYTVGGGTSTVSGSTVIGYSLFNGTIAEPTFYNERILTGAEIVQINTSNPLNIWPVAGNFTGPGKDGTTNITAWDNMTVNCLMYNATVSTASSCGNNISVDVRGSSDNSTWGAWSAATNQGNNFWDISVTDQYLQYRINYNRYNNLMTPVVQNVSTGVATTGQASASGLTISPVNASVQDNILGQATYTHTTSSNGRITFIWYINNATSFTETSSVVATGTQVSSTLASSFTSGNDYINFSAQACTNEATPVCASAVFSNTTFVVNLNYNYTTFPNTTAPIQITKPEQRIFSVILNDPDNDAVATWYLDNVSVGSGTTYSVVSSQLTSYSTPTLTVNLTDGQFNNSESWSLEILPGETDLLGAIAITMFMIFIIGGLAFIPVFTRKFVANEMGHLIIKRSCWTIIIFLVMTSFGMMATISEASGLSLTQTMLTFMRIFGWAGYIAMVLLFVKTLLDLTKLYKVKKQKERMGGF